ncbi:MAG: hypothetical protein ACKVUT_14615 [Gaiella sp.]
MGGSVGWGSRVLAFSAFAAFLVAVAYGVGSPLLGNGEAGPSVAQPAARTPTPPSPQPVKPAVRSVPVSLDAVGGFDPEGDGSENDVQAVNAVDGNRTSAWRTENYRQFFKSGIGLLLDAGRAARVTSVTIRTTTPGFLVEVRVGGSETGPFSGASAIVPVNRQVTTIKTRAVRGRYVLLWLSGFKDGSISLEEVTATRRA